MSKGVSGPQHPWAAGRGGTSQQEIDLVRGVGKSGMVLAIPMTSSNHGKLHITSPWGIPAMGSSANRLCKQGRHQLGAVSAVCVAFCVAGYAGRAANSSSVRAAACSAHPQD